MTCVTILNEIVKSKLLLLRTNFNLKELDSKTQKKLIEETENLWNFFIKSGQEVASPLDSVCVVAKSKNQQVGKIASNTLKSILDGRIIGLTDAHGNGFRVKIL